MPTLIVNTGVSQVQAENIDINMSDSVAVCEIEPELIKSLKEFRFSKKKENHALVMKVDREKQMIIEDFRLEEDCDPDLIIEELPTHQPRFLVIFFLRKSERPTQKCNTL